MESNYRTDRNTPAFGRTGALPTVTFDAGLRAYMLRIYNIMAMGLMLTGLAAWGAANIPALTNLLYVTRPEGGISGMTGLGMIVAFAPLAMIFGLGFGINRIQASTAKGVFMLFSVLMGLSLSSIFFTYTTESIARVFFISAGTFAGVSLWGYTTKRDLTGMGHFMIMGLIGLIIASLVNIFMQSSALQFATSVVGVIVFTGLTAWDTQRLKEMYAENAGSEAVGKLAVMGALSLYLDFINLFMSLLQLLGRRE